MSTKLDSGNKSFLRLIARDADEQGWALVSEMVWPLVERMPAELIELERAEKGGRVRLSTQGQEIINAMAWL